MNRDPEVNVQKLPIEPGMSVADFGAGTGAYVFLMSKEVGSSGKVYAVDVQKDLMDRLKNEAEKLFLRNIEYVLGDIETVGGTKIADQSLDFVLIANTLFLTGAKYQVFVEAKRVLKQGGKLGVIEWSESFGGIGPHPNQVVSDIETKEIAEQAGFEELSDFSAGNHHYGLIFQKKV